MTNRQNLLLQGVLRASISMPVLAVSLADRARETGVYPERAYVDVSVEASAAA